MRCRTKYGMMRKAVIGQSNTDPLSSEMIYALPLFRDITISGPIYLARILWLSNFSIAVFQTSTRSPSLKL